MCQHSTRSARFSIAQIGETSTESKRQVANDARGPPVRTGAVRRAQRGRGAALARVVNLLPEHLRRDEHDPFLGHLEALAILREVDADLHAGREPAGLVDHYAPQHAVPADLDV